MTAPSQPRDAVLDLPQPYLLFLGDPPNLNYAKTAFGLRDWAGDRVVGEYACPGADITAGLEKLTPAQAYAKGARAVVIGVANSGGFIPDNWLPPLVEALDAGLDIISGMHNRLGEFPALKEAAERTGRRLIDVRVPPKSIPVGTGVKRPGKRILTVGTDCALGKKYTALAITEALKARGLDADFRATGQTGIMIAGRGIPMDAVIADFSAGAAEMIAPAAAPDHWDVIEGQGSLFHPAYAGVSLGLLHGSQPDVIVVCHEPGRTEVLGCPGYALPSIQETIDLNLTLGRRTNPAIRCAGVSLNTSKLTAEEAQALCDRLSAELGLPVADPIRKGAAFERLVDACVGS